MKGIIKHLKNKQLLSFLVIVVFVGASFLIGKSVQAGGPLDWVIGLFGGLMAAIVYMLGKLLMVLMGILIYIAQYSNFIDSPAIAKGWVMVRDLCNMFFVVILLVISFATILRIEKYNYKKWLPKLILMAILINFSKTICGVMIDVAQIIMLSFVNAFKTIGGTNLSTMLGIQDWQKMSKDEPGSSNWSLLASYLLAVIYVVISIVVIAAMIGVLVMRIIMIWVYVVLSPLAYLMSSFPDGQSYASKWWTQFTQNLIIGPVLAFFIWLSFATITPGANVSSDVLGMSKLDADGEERLEDSTQAGMGTSDIMIQFIISIGLLIGGLKVSQEIGGAAGGMAGKISSKGFGMAKIAAAGVGGYALGRARAGSKAVGRGALGLASFGIKKAGQGLGSKTMEGAGNIGLAWRQDLITSNKELKTKKRKQFLQKMGVGEGAADAYNQLTPLQKAKLSSPISSLVPAAMKSVRGGQKRRSARKEEELMKQGQENVAENLKPLNAQWDATKQKIQEAEARKDEAAVLAGEAEIKEIEKKQAEVKAGVASPEYLKQKEKTAKLEAKEKHWENWQTNYEKINTAAAQQIAADPKKARDTVEYLANNQAGINDLSKGDLYSALGQKNSQNLMVKVLAEANNPTSKQARDNLIKHYSATSTFNSKEKEILESLMKTIAASMKSGQIDSSSLSSLTPVLDSAASRAGLETSTVKDFESKVKIDYRSPQTTTLSEATLDQKKDGKLLVDAFAKGQDEKTLIGADFNKMKADVPDLDPEMLGANFNPDSEFFKPVIDALVKQINQAKIELEQKKSAGDINDQDYNKQLNDLNKAGDRLKSNDLKNVGLVNSAHPQFKRDSNIATAYHEEIHKAGIKDEGLTENLTQSLMKNKLYGRNPATGRRHASEIAQEAKEMKDSGASNEEIEIAMDVKIKERIYKEARSRAQRVLAQEQGKAETETEAVKDMAGVKKDETETAGVKINTSQLEEKFADFANTMGKTTDSLAKITKQLKIKPITDFSDPAFKTRLLTAINNIKKSGAQVDIAKILSTTNKQSTSPVANEVTVNSIIKEGEQELQNNNQTI